MPIITFLIIVALIGFLLWAIIKFIPMPEQYKPVVVGIGIILVIIWTIGVLGGWAVTMPHIR